MDYSKKSKTELIEKLKFLIKREENISLVLNNINEIMFHVSFDKKGGKHFEYLSPHVESVLGISTEEYIKINNSKKENEILKHVHPDDLIRTKKESKNKKPQQKNYSFTYRFFNKKLDKYIWLKETVVAIYDEKSKRKTAIFGTAKNISDKKENEEKYKSLFVKNLAGVFITENKIIIDCNNSFAKIFGYKSRTELIGKNANCLYFSKKDRSEYIKELKKKKYLTNYKSRYINKKGEELWILINVSLKENERIEGTLIDITEQVKSEKKLKESEEKYKTLFTKNLAGVFITEGKLIVDCNDSFAKIYGYKSKSEVIGKDPRDFYFFKREREEYLNELKKKRYLTNYRIKHKNKKGEEIWTLTNVSLKDKEKTEGTVVDITEQVKSEKKLKESEENYKKLIDDSPYGILIQIKGSVVYGNKEAYRILNLTTTKNININDIILTGYKEKAQEVTKKALLGENVPFKEFKIKKSITNETIYIEAKPSLIKYNGEKAIQVFFKDITIEKQLLKEKIRATIAEESNKIFEKEIAERKKIEKKLIENEKYTKSIINSSLDIICATDKNGDITEFNAAAEQAFGYKKEEIMSKGIGIVYFSKQEYKEVIEQLEKKGSFIGEVENKRKNGEIFTSFLSASILHNEEGELIGTMGVSRDITELKEAEQQLVESEEKYRDLFENATDLIQSLDMYGNILYVNNAWKKTLGYSNEELKNKNIFEVIHPDCLVKCESIFEEISKKHKGETQKVSLEFRTKNGEKIIADGNVSLKYKNGKRESTRAILRDVTEDFFGKKLQIVYNNVAKIITEKVSAEEIYEGVRLELGTIINTDVFIISYALSEDTITFSYYYDKIKGKGRVEKKNRTNGNGINEYFLKQNKTKILKRKDQNKIISNGGYELIGEISEAFIGVPLKIKNKTIGVLSLQSYTNENEFNDKSIEILDFISGALAFAVQRKQDENKIHEQAARLKSIIESSTYMFWTYNKEKGITSFNQTFYDEIKRAYGKTPVLNDKQPNRIAIEGEDRLFWDKKYKKAFEGETINFTMENISPKGERIIREVVINPIVNEDKKVIDLSGISHDITEKKLAEEELKESLKEKEVLLKEIHHRVKNNLQVISSILNLQSSYVKDENTLNILTESQDRIKSMAFIHESLYRTTDFSRINFSEYTETLSKNLVHSYDVSGSLVELKLSVGNIFLNLDQSIPCGLIINELISNSLKYAFSDKQKGIIKIRLFEKKDQVNLIVEDNGLGLPKEINYRETESLGLQLVITLVEQVNGTIELNSKKGTKYTIIFKKEQ